MKKIIFISLVTSASFISYAQGDEAAIRKFLDQTSGNLLYIFQYTDTKGSPFLTDNWIEGKILLNDGVSFSNLQIKFDLYNSQFILNRHDTSFQISSIVKEVRLFPTADTLNVWIFKNGYPTNEKINAKTYLQVLAEGKIIFLKYLKKDMEEYTEYGDATKYKRFQERNQYFALYKGEYKVVILSRKSLQDILEDKWAVISEYLTKNNLNGKDEKSWKLAIQYYNTL